MSKGRVTISRYTSNVEPDGICIEFIDDSSGVAFATMTLTLEKFAQAITGQGYVEAELETRGLEYIGKKAENKTEVIKLEPPYGDKKKELMRLRDAIKLLEVDGWRHREGDILNSHNYHQDGIHIVFFRYV